MQQASLDNTIILILPYTFNTDQHNIQHKENNTEKWTNFKWWEHNVIVNSWCFFSKKLLQPYLWTAKDMMGGGNWLLCFSLPSTHLTECNNVACMIHMIYKEFHQFSYSTSVIWNPPQKTSLAQSQNPQALGYQRLLSLHAAPTLACLVDVNKLCLVTSAKYM